MSDMHDDREQESEETKPFIFTNKGDAIQFQYLFCLRLLFTNVGI